MHLFVGLCSIICIFRLQNIFKDGIIQLMKYAKEGMSVSKQTKKQITALKAVEALKQKYPEAKCSLNADTPFQLLVATRLSAQCTDARVNIVTPALFAELPTPEAFISLYLSLNLEFTSPIPLNGLRVIDNFSIHSSG